MGLPGGAADEGAGDDVHKAGEGADKGNDGGQDGGDGAGDDGKDGSSKKDDGSAGGGQEDGTHQGKDNSEKRINDLMSNWQKEQNRANKAESEREFLMGILNKRFGGKGNDGEEGDVPEYLKPGWEPKTMEELRQALVHADERAFQRMLKHSQGQEQARDEAKKTVDNFIEQVKSADPDFDEDDFFDYAAEIGFPIQSDQHLRAVYLAYSKGLTARTATADLAKQKKEERKGDKVNKPGSGGQPGPVIPYSVISGAGTFHEAAMEALKRHK